MRFNCSTIVLFVSCVLTFSLSASAQESGEGVDSQGLLVTPGPSHFATVSSSDIAGHREASFAAFVHYYRKPLALELSYVSGEKETVFLVKDVVATDFVWAFGLFDVLQLGLVLPVVMYQDGEGRAVEGLMPEDTSDAGYALASSALRDIRFHIKARFLGKNAAVPDRRGFGLGLDLGIGIPSGDEQNFAGELGALFLPNIIADYHMCKFSAAINLGARFRTETAELGESQVGQQMAYGVAATGHYLKRHLLISGELTGLSNFEDFKQTTFEYRGAVGYAPDARRTVTLWLAAGSAFGSAEVLSIPQFRMLFAISYIPGGGGAEAPL